MSNDTDEQLLTYEDIPNYAPIRYRGVSGQVIDRGPRVVPGTNTPMLRVALDEVPPGGEGKDYVIAKETVNKHLREQRTLWVDFGFKLSGGE